MDSPELKHTPGEWIFSDHASNVFTKTNITGNIIAMPPAPYKESMMYWPHNAKLICAAPDLLNAAYMAYFHLTSGSGDPDFFIKQLADAIDKATK